MARSRLRAALQAKPQEPQAKAENTPAQQAEQPAVNARWGEFALGPVHRSASQPGAGAEQEQNPVTQKKTSAEPARDFPLALKPKAQPAAAPPPRKRREENELAVSAANDPAELEADRVADQVMGGGPKQGAVADISQKPEMVQREATDTTPRPTRSASAVNAALRGGGKQMDDKTRRGMEKNFGADFSEVRIHTDAQAAQSAKGLQARAYASGKDVVFNSGEYAPDTSRGKHLLAHELTHVVQQGAAPPAPSGRSTGFRPSAPPPGKGRVQRNPDLDQMIQDEFDDWADSYYEYKAAGDYAQAAYASRVTLLLQGVKGDDFADEQELKDFFSENYDIALDEDATLEEAGEWALNLTEAFPLTWSDMVYDALYLDVDTEGLDTAKEEKKTEMENAGERVPGEVGDGGLPVPYGEAKGLSEFKLKLKHVQLYREHVVKDLAIASRDYAVVGWGLGFYIVWNAMAEMYADQVASGETIVNYEDYNAFVETKQEGLRALGTRIASVTTDEMMKAVDKETTDITKMAFVQVFASSLLGLIPAMKFWMDGTKLWDDKLAEADKTIAGEAGDDKILRAMGWAYENDYFSGAGLELIQSIWAQKWKILGLGGLLIGLQMIPGVNIAVDAAIIIMAGKDAIEALMSLQKTFSAVAASTTVVELQRNAAKMAASMEGDGLRIILDLLAVGAAAKGIRTKIDALKKGGLSEEEAIKQALKEATGKEADAIRGAAARGRIQKAGLDPEGVLEAVMDNGVSPEVLEQALMSGLKPNRLASIADGAADIAQAQKLIKYAGSNASPVNALLDAGVPVARIAEMMEGGLGLRELGAVQKVLKATGDASKAEAMISDMASLGPGNAAQLGPRLTSDGLANVYQAGGREALQAVDSTIAAEAAGKIAGLDDWVSFTIKTQNKTGQDLANAISELREAQRVAAELKPGEVVRIGGDAHGGGAKSFDMRIEDAAGNVVRNVDMTSVNTRLEGFGDLGAGIRHGIAKAPTVAAGTAEVSIRVKISPSYSLGKGRRMEWDANGNWQRVEKNGMISSKGDVLQQAADNMPHITGSNTLKAVNVVRPDGSLIGKIVNNGGKWTVVR